MKPELEQTLADLHSKNKNVQDTSFTTLMTASKEQVDWAYEVWDELVKTLSSKDNRQRAIASQVLCNLAKSDPENRLAKDFDALLNVTRDERFVTARHCMQSLWKVGIAGEAQEKQLIEGLELRYHECVSEKNCTLIRYDILQNFKTLYEHSKKDTLKARALSLIDLELDPKYRKKYLGLWKGN